MVPKRIAGIRFEVLSPQEIRRMSVAKIITPETYDDDGFPIDGGLMDLRLGVIDPGLRCRTCGGRAGECPGHFGHIELAAPVIHVGYAKLIAKLLNATCRECGRLRLKDNVRDRFIQEIEDRKRLGQDYDEVIKEVYRRAKAVRKCPHCGADQVEVKFEKPTFYYIGEHRLTPKDVREWLEKIPDEDLPALGLNPKAVRPEWFVLTVLPVPPVTARPSIILETGQRSEDDLTHKLVDIIRINQRFLENKEAGAPHLILEDLWELLQYHVTTYLDNEVSGIPPARHRSGRPLKTLSQRLKGKEGRFRGSLSGKRVNFSARTVISPDPCLSINEVGVPKEVAEELTVPIFVTEKNIDEAREYILRTEHPKANYVIKPDGRRIRVMESNREELAEKIEPGWIVERQLKDGDIVLFNRQPSLHRMSIMAHYVRVLPGKTFRLNPAVCVAGDTEVLLDGFKVKIEELEDIWNIRGLYVLTCKWESRIIEPSRIKAFHRINPKDYGLKCFEIRTESGTVLRVTEDHPFYTNRGVISAGDLRVGDLVASYPIELPELELVDGVIINEEDLMLPDCVNEESVLKELKELDLLPLKLSDLRLVILARIIGRLLGNGTLTTTGSDGFLRIQFRGRKRDLEAIVMDLRRLGFNIESCMTCIEPENSEEDIESEIWISSQALGVLLHSLGVPIGDKTMQEFSVPEWIMRAPRYIKRAFISAYFGSELTEPDLESSDKPVFRVLKSEKYVENGLKFVEEVGKILEEFGVKISDVKVEDWNSDGTKVISVELSNELESLVNLYGRIGYEYAYDKEKLARFAYHYLRIKKKYLGGDGYEKSSRIGFECEASRLFHGVYGYDLDFRRFVAEVTQGLSESGVVWDRIVEIRECELNEAYDITTESENHNFFAFNILTGNCPPYNADFDGDEMNLHVPQSLEAQAEAKILMTVQEHILSPRFGGPIIGGIHDHISGLYLLTRGERLFTKEEVMTLIRPIDTKELPPPKVVKDGKEYWTGKQIFSLILPDITLEFKAEICRGCDECKKEECPYDAYVIIRRGELIKGTIDEKAVGAFKGVIIDEIVRKHGTERAKKFIDDMTHLAIRSIMFTGFTIGIDDEDIPDEAIAQIKEIVADAEKRVKELIRAYEEGNLEPMPGRSLEETLEMMIMRELGRARDRAGRIAERFLGLNNPAVIMAVSGARGSMLNLTQMSACIGQQSVRGERINRGYTYTNRTLPHFKPGDLGAKARGFVESSYKKGLNPIEFFFHAMGGREGLVDTACRTSISGYLQRRMINALQDLKVEYDGTVREQTSGVVVQFRYGEDGIDPMKSFRGKAVDIDRIIKEVLEG